MSHYWGVQQLNLDRYVNNHSDVLFKNVRREVTVFSESLLGSSTAESGQVGYSYRHLFRAVEHFCMVRTSLASLRFGP